MKFGQQFAEALKKRGLTQVEAAKKLQTSQSVVSYYSRLDKPPGRKVMAHIIEKLNIEKGEFGAVGLAVNNTGALSSQVREGGRMYRLDDDCDDERVVWMERMRERWSRYPHEQIKIELAVRTALPDDADKIIEWMKEK